MQALARPFTRTVLFFAFAAFAAVLIAAWTQDASADGAAVVTTGNEHSCVVTSGGAAQCFGSNAYGQIGVGVIGGPDICGGQGSTEVPCAKTAMTVSGLGSGVQSIAAASRFTCALTDLGGVKCWGANSSGQLGADDEGPETCPATFDTACSTTPLDISGITGATAITVGSSHGCVITAAGGVMCWGGNFYGQLGDGDQTGPDTCGTLGCSLTPVQVAGLASGVDKISAGASHTCALLLTGAMKCWGNNWKGQLGIGTHEGPVENCFSGRACSPTPVNVPGLASLKDVSTGANHTCVLTNTDTVKCFGANAWGQLGTGSPDGPENCLGFFDDPCSDSPVDTVDLAGVTYLNESAADTVCAVLSGGGVKCWGANNQSQMSIGTKDGPETCNTGFKCSTKPMDAQGLSDISAIATGGEHGCAITTDGAVKCWGSKFHGATGDDTWSPSAFYAHVPVDVIGLGGGTPTPSPVPPAARVWGDLNCSGGFDPVDALGALRFDAGLSFSQGPGCLALDQQVQVNGITVAYGDVDCNGAITPVDPLKILRKDAGLSVSREAGCPEIGEAILL